MKFFLSFGTLLLVLPMTVMAVQTETYGWEGSDTVLGVYGNGVPDLEYVAPVHGGSQSLEFVETPLGGTPQAYVGWIQNLSDGDIVTASFWVYDDTPEVFPSSRIWAHYNANYANPTAYDGSASGNYDYSQGNGWELITWEWTIDDDSTHSGLMIEARIYSAAEFDTIWIDDLTITAPDGATILFPNIPVALVRQTWADIKASF